MIDKPKKDTISSLRTLVEEVQRKRQEDLAEHEEDQAYNFKCMLEISDDLDDSLERNTKLCTLLAISTGINVAMLVGAVLCLLGIK